MREAHEQEFRQWAHARRSQLRSTAFLLCGDWHLADDLTQATLTKMFVAWPRIRASDGPDGYAHRVLVNAFLDDRRRPWRRERSVDVLPEPPTRDRTDAVVDRQVVLDALAQLPPRQRAVLVPAVLGGPQHRADRGRPQLHGGNREEPDGEGAEAPAAPPGAQRRRHPARISDRGGSMSTLKQLLDIAVDAEPAAPADAVERAVVAGRRHRSHRAVGVSVAAAAVAATVVTAGVLARSARRLTTAVGGAVPSVAPSPSAAPASAVTTPLPQPAEQPSTLCQIADKSLVIPASTGDPIADCEAAWRQDDGISSACAQGVREAWDGRARPARVGDTGAGLHPAAADVPAGQRPDPAHRVHGGPAQRR